MSQRPREAPTGRSEGERGAGHGGRPGAPGARPAAVRAASQSRRHLADARTPRPPVLCLMATSRARHLPLLSGRRADGRAQC